MRALAENLALGWGPALAALTFVLGTGSCLLPRRWLRLPAPWPAALAFVLGWHAAVLLVLLLGALGGLSRAPLLAGLWLPGALATFHACRSGRLQAVCASPGPFNAWRDLPWPDRSLLLLCAAFLLLLVVLATAPPSKHDDLHYHLLVPRRGLLDRQWQCYATPYLQTAPHIAHECLLAPLLEIGLPSATGAFSVLWAVVLLALVRARVARASPRLAVIAVTVLLVGLNQAVWWTSPSPTSVGALWASLLFLWLHDRAELRAPDALPGFEYGAGAALFAGALFLTKVSFVLPAGLALLVVLAQERRALADFGGALVGMGVGLLFCGPWVLRAWLGTGAVLGFASAELFGSQTFDEEALHTALATSRAINQAPAPLFALPYWAWDVLRLRDVNLLYPVLALGVGGAALLRERRWGLALAVVCSSGGLALIVPHSLRFHLFAGNGLLLAAALGAPSWSAWARAFVPWLVGLASLPSLAVATYYSLPFWPVALGLQERTEFLRDKTALYDVHAWCHAQVPLEARFCVDMGGLPRLFYLKRIALAPEGLTRRERADHFDLAAFMLRNKLDHLLTDRPESAPAGLVLVRSFENVVLEAYRTPGRASERGTVWLYRTSARRGRTQ